MDSLNVHCEGRKYDLAEFLRKHPGGVNYIDKYNEKDITKRMADANHSEAAYYLLREYKKGGRDEQSMENNKDLEHLIDWNKPLLPQVGNLGQKYAEWVHYPVDRELRLFSSQILESLSITPWYIIPLVWLPVSACFCYDGYCKYIRVTGARIPILSIALSIKLGILMWSLLEYCLHRWVFHIIPSGKSKLMIFLHFTIHGLHHKAPFDTRRLVFPPAPAALIAFGIYQVYCRVFPEAVFHLIFGGNIIGYVIYDMTHFYLHNGSPTEGSYLYFMKRYHNNHHFNHHNAGFGISSPGWDTIFGTIIKLRHLKMGIKWR